MDCIPQEGPVSNETLDAQPRHPLTDKVFFLSTILEELVGAIESLVGFEEAAGLMHIVGHNIAEKVHPHSEEGHLLTADQALSIFNDCMKAKGGEAYLLSPDPDKRVIKIKECLFGKEHVKNHPSLCKLTTSILGRFIAQNHGYSRIEIKETIAQGCAECHINIDLKPSSDTESSHGIEFFGDAFLFDGSK
ncbi:MAG: methanogen output domain 1-containing protein [Alphaproteobacteria bacterium]|nr:methanogen output domain 1-containing protein [Alphaproteobacteria bacterium]